MSLPPLEGEHAKLIPQQAIAKDTISLIQGFPVRGTGHPYYAWIPPRGTALLINHPRHPPGHPVSDVPPSKDLATKQENEKILTHIINGEVPYDEALKSTSKDFFDTTSSKERVRIHDGRHWRLYKGTYFAQFNWKTNGPAAGAPKYTRKQMNHVLRDLIVAGGRVCAATHKLQKNGFIAGDEEYFWTADDQEYDLIEEKWILREAEETTFEDVNMSTKDQENLKMLEEKYPTRLNVRRLRTWAGPKHGDVAHDDEERLPPHPTSSRFGNPGMKRKEDHGDGSGQTGNDGNPPVAGGNAKPRPKRTGRKPPATKRKGKTAVPPKTITTRGQTSKTGGKK